MKFVKEKENYKVMIKAMISDNNVTFAADVRYSLKSGYVTMYEFTHVVKEDSVFSIAPLITQIEEFVAKCKKKDDEYDRKKEQVEIHLKFYGFEVE